MPSSGTPAQENRMTPSVVAAFPDRPSAEAAVERLRGSGLPTHDVRLHDTQPDAENAAALQVDEVVSGGFFGNAAHLLDGLFNTKPDEARAETYADVVRREATLVSVQVDDRETAEQVEAMLTDAGARRVSTLPQPGLES
jgi:hypothetical protein